MLTNILYLFQTIVLTLTLVLYVCIYSIRCLQYKYNMYTVHISTGYLYKYYAIRYPLRHLDTTLERNALIKNVYRKLKDYSRIRYGLEFQVNTSPSYPTLPYPTLPYLTLPYLTLPYLTLPYITLPYLTLPYPTLPYPTLPIIIPSITRRIVRSINYLRIRCIHHGVYLCMFTSMYDVSLI